SSAGVAVYSLACEEALERRGDLSADRGQSFAELALGNRSLAVHREPHDLVEAVRALTQLAQLRGCRRAISHVLSGTEPKNEARLRGVVERALHQIRIVSMKPAEHVQPCDHA